MNTPTAPGFGPDELRGLKFFRPLENLLVKLHQLYPDPKRTLHYDDYLVLLLLAFYNPIVSSLRAIQHASTFGPVQKGLGVSKTSLGSLSENARLFDPEYLRQLFLALAREALAHDALPRPPGFPADLSLLGVDGTLWSLLPRMAREFYAAGPRSGRPPGFKAHLQLDLLRGVPAEADLTDGYASERRALEARLQTLCFYLMDAGYIDYALFQKIIDLGSHFLTRARTDTVYEVLSTQPLSPAAQAAGVISDFLVRLGSQPHADKLKQPLRLIRAQVVLPPPHNLSPTRRQGGRLPHARGEPQVVELVLLTSHLDLPAELLVQLYAYRWQIELFFRWFKCVLGCSHFFSESKNGMALQLYAALIASLLVVLYTGRRPTKRLLETLHFYLTGWAEWHEVQAYLSKLEGTKTENA